MRRKVNVKLLAYLLIAALVLAVGIHVLHGLQDRRNAGALLEQAARAEEAGRNDQAVKHLRSYLGFAPEDTDALARYGELLDKLATTPTARVQALLVLEQVLRRDPARHELRRRLVHLAMHPQVARFADAREHLEILLRDAFPADGELEFLLGRCHEAGADYAQAAQWFDKAVQHAPHRREAYLALATLYRRRLNQPKQADQVMDRLVTNNPETFQALLARGRYRTTYHTVEEARADIARAAELAPDDADVILTSATLAIRQGDVAPARTQLTRGVHLHPKNGAFYLALSEVETRAQRPAEAIACLRRGIDAVPDTADLIWALANLRISQGEDPTDEMARLAQRGTPQAQRDFLQARLLIKRAKWLEASRLLEKAHTELRSRPALIKQADLYLGQCYGHLGNLDQQYAAFRRAVDAEPLWEPACLGLASAQAALGRIDDALDTYRRVVAHAPAARVPMARLLIARNLHLPVARQNWPEVEQLLTDAEKQTPELTDVVLLRAEMLAANGQYDRAETILTQARDRQPQQADAWIALAALADRQNKPDAAEKLLDEASRQVGDRVELRLARAWHASVRGGDQLGRTLAGLKRDITSFSTDEQRRLLSGLGDCNARNGNVTEAIKLYSRLAKQSPADLNVRAVLFDLALQKGDDARLQGLVQEMEAIEGKDGSLWRYGQACILIRQARNGKGVALEQAKAILAQLTTLRPTWARVALAQAEISDSQKDAAAAIKSYQRALELGERSPSALRRLVELLYQQRRYAEADEVIQKLPERDLTATHLQRLAAEIALRRQEPEQALQRARRAVAANSTDYRDYLWLGQFLGASAQKDEAEPVLRRAVALAENVPETWIALVLFLARAGQKDRAEAALRQAEAKLPAQQATLALSPCYEALGRPERARRAYADALKTRPDDAALLRAAAGFCLRNGPVSDAERHLRKLLDLAKGSREDHAWARRTLALLLAAPGDYGRWREALGLLGLSEDTVPPKTTADNLDEQRVRAVVLAAQKNRKQRQKAVALLEDLRSRQPLAAEDQFLLAQLYDALGDWTKAREQMLPLLAASRGNEGCLAHYARSLLRRGDLSEAEIWLTKLEKIPDAGRTFVVVELKARLLAARGQMTTAIDLVEAYQKGQGSLPADPRVRLTLATSLLVDLDQAQPTKAGFAATDRLYRELAAAQPDRVLDHVAFLARRGRAEEALELCGTAWSKCRPDVAAAASITVVRAVPANGAAQQRAERWLTAALTKGRSAGVLLCLADLRDLQGRYADADKLYREVLATEPRHVVALNNLAYLLALQGNRSAEALDLLQRAVAVAGPTPELLDTRAVIYLKSGQPERAVADLEEAVADSPAPVLSFHLAQAYQTAKNRSAAQNALLKAKHHGLQADQVHALERPAYQALHAELEVR